MRKWVLVAVASLALGAPPAFAQGGINLFWDDCSVAGLRLRTFACNTNTGPAFTMVFSVIPSVEMPQFVAADLRIDALVQAATLPPWWQAATGQCRAGAISASFDPNTFPNLDCPDIWGGALPLFAQQIEPGYLANAFRIRAAGALAAPSPITAAMLGTELNVCTVSILRSHSTGADACAGCLAGVCFVGTQCVLQQPAGVGDYYVTTPATNNFIDFQISTYECYTPTRNRTWGAVKGLYR